MSTASHWNFTEVFIAVQPRRLRGFIKSARRPDNAARPALLLSRMWNQRAWLFFFIDRAIRRRNIAHVDSDETSD
jgi:hypothetical protein